METQHHDPVDEPTCLSRRSFFKTAAAATVATAAGEHEIPGLGADVAEQLRDRAAELARLAQEDV